MLTADSIKGFFDSHWTVRKYKDEKIPDHHMELIMYAGQRAPTDATAQMYSVIHLKSQPLREKVAELSKNPHIAKASDAFVLCADVARLKEILMRSKFDLGQIPHVAVHFAIGDAVMCGQNMLIAAEMLGYRGCWIGGILTELQEISKLLHLPQGVFPFAGLTLGIPDEKPQKRPRLRKNLVFHTDRYQPYDKKELDESVSEMAKITLNGDWAQTLNRYFGQGGSMEARNSELLKYLNSQIPGWTK